MKIFFCCSLLALNPEDSAPEANKQQIEPSAVKGKKDEQVVRDKAALVDCEKPSVASGIESAREEDKSTDEGAVASSAHVASPSVLQNSSSEDEADYDDQAIHPELEKELHRFVCCFCCAFCFLFHRPQ